MSQDSQETQDLEADLGALAKTLESSFFGLDRQAILEKIQRREETRDQREALSAVSGITQGRVLDILMDYAQERGATLVTVTHDQDLLPRFERVILLFGTAMGLLHSRAIRVHRPVGRNGHVSISEIARVYTWLWAV